MNQSKGFVRLNVPSEQRVLTVWALASGARSLGRHRIFPTTCVSPECCYVVPWRSAAKTATLFTPHSLSLFLSLSYSPSYSPSYSHSLTLSHSHSPRTRHHLSHLRRVAGRTWVSQATRAVACFCTGRVAGGVEGRGCRRRRSSQAVRRWERKGHQQPQRADTWAKPGQKPGTGDRAPELSHQVNRGAPVTVNRREVAGEARAHTGCPGERRAGIRWSRCTWR